MRRRTTYAQNGTLPEWFTGTVGRRDVPSTCNTLWSQADTSFKIVAVYLDPANFKNIGDGHTIADQINEVLEPYDLAAIPASNDRMGGWQLMYLWNGPTRLHEDSLQVLVSGLSFRPHHLGRSSPS